MHSIRIFCARLKIDQVVEMEEFCMITLREVESKTNMAGFYRKAVVMIAFFFLFPSISVGHFIRVIKVK